ncbi:translocation/assembly module TamB domain-containing protein [Wenyingzhuangia aestuarii]|uniref:translocation/assembly module TamB domain-containing protein n=1 Tax=Wenyingzhuangia aestuarii TaxID=1647582 RepID=UPI00143A6621|nr:translocation/assembly module TamB [Wenyingzhuangia aestuarii]NJB82625.1 hypothetical protein [Wenyingzhuangia aestuarii]
MLVFALQFGQTQTAIVNKFFDYLNEKYNVSFQLKEIKIDPFGNFNIEDLLIEDQYQDTLIFVENLKGALVDYHKIKNKVLSFENIEVKNGWVDDYLYTGDTISSLTLFSSKFKTDKKSTAPLELLFENIKSSNLRYVRRNDEKSIVDFHHISGQIASLRLLGPNVDIVADSLRFVDVYGIDYNKLKTDFSYSLSNMSFKNTEIHTTNSDLFLNVDFKYKPGELGDFVTKVNVDATINESDLSLKDIHKIYPHFKNGKTFDIKSTLSGTLNDLDLEKTKIISKDNKTYLIGDFTLKNSIVNRNDFWFRAKDAAIELVPESLTDVVPNQYHKSLPTNFYGLELVNFDGDLFVSRSKLVITGGLVTNLGKLQLNGLLDHLNKNTRTVDVKILHGAIIKNKHLKDFKDIEFNGDFKGSIAKNNLLLNTNLFFKKIQYKQLKLSNSNLSLSLANQDIKANFITKDSLLSFEANIDYLNKGVHKKTYGLDFEITKARLAKLFPKSASYQKNLSAVGNINITQNRDSILAKGLVDNLRIETASDTLALSAIDLNFSSEGKNKNIALDSKNLLTLDVEGAFDFADFEKLVENALYKFIPGKKVRTNVKNQTLNFGLEIYPEFLKSITNRVVLNQNVKISGVLDAEGDKGLIYASAPSFSSKDFKVDSLRIFLDNSNQWINSNISAKQFRFKKQVYDDLSLLGKKLNDTLFVRSNFNTDKIDNRAVFNLTTENDALTLGIENVYFKYLNSTWVNKEKRENKIYYNYKTGEWYFNGISFANKNQEFDFDGSIKKGHSKNLRLALKNINLAEVLPGIDSLKVGGIASGEVFFREKNTLLKPDGNLVVRKLKINGVDYGLMKTSIKPSGKPLGYDLNFNISNNKTQNIDAAGEIIVNETDFLQSQMELNVVLNNLKLSSLSPLGRNVLSAIRGQAKGNFKVSGQINDFNTVGFIDLTNAGLKFPYLNTNYNFTGDTRVNLEGKSFVFKNINLQDNLYKTKGSLKGRIDYDKYNNWNLDLRVDTRNLLVMNTEQQEDSKYYGTGFMDGFATIKGLTSNLAINVTGRTLENTKFVLPISDVKQVETNRFIYFKEVETDSDNDNEEDDVSGTLGGISVVLNLDITKDALGEVVIDQTSGSSLQGRADGRLLIDIDRYFNLKMYGDLIVDEGLYNFKYGGIVNKPFIVQRGGTVSWNGDPYKAELNIEAVHSVKANPKVLLENLVVNRKIEVDLVTHVTGELFDSNQDFMIEIPNASSTVASELDFKLNIDENSKMRQFFSLLVSKSFFDENSLNNTSAVLSNTTSELISNAVTDIFNKDGGKLQFNFGYTAGETSEVEDLAIDNQIDIGVETEINDRILINGKLGVPVGTKTQSAVVGEVKVEFLLNKDGSLRSSVFNRQNEIQYSEEEQGYTQGIGLNYQIDFNNLKEMLQKLRIKSKDKALKEEETVIVDD